MAYQVKHIRDKTSESRGTDDPFYKLMHIGGEAILTLIGVKSPKDYKPKAVVLKEKKLYPDIIAEPKTDGDRVFIEFQGYKDPMIRYSLTSKITAYCARENYTGSILGVIIYTDDQYKDSAIPIDICGQSDEFRITGRFKEIVLSEFTEKQLIEIDPRLIVLAPFTLGKSIKKTLISNRCYQWKETIKKVYTKETQDESLEILGLFILNRYKNLSLQEVFAMLNLNLEKTKAGKELISMGEMIGIEKGVKKGIKEGVKKGIKEGALLKSRQMLVCAVEEKFGGISEKALSVINRISKEQIINELFKKVLRCHTIEEFIESLKEVEPGLIY